MKMNCLQWPFIKYPCLYDKNHRFHKKKNVAQKAWEAAADELDFAEDGTNFFCYFDVFTDFFLFYPFLPNIPFQYPGIARLSHRS